MNKADYLAAIKQQAAALAATARQNTEPPVPQIPTCPAWNLTGLVLHVGVNHRHVRQRLQEGEGEPSKVGQADLKLPAEWQEWYKTNQAPADKPIPAGLIEWFEGGAAELVTALDEADEQTPVWNWNATSKLSPTLYPRQMAAETAIHRWDAENAVSKQPATPIPAGLARDGISLLLSFLPIRRKFIKEPVGQGELYHLHCTDGAGEWLIKFDKDETTIKEEHAKGDIALRGTASDLLLFLWGRIPGEQLEVFGDKSLIKRYFELVPPM